MAAIAALFPGAGQMTTTSPTAIQFHYDLSNDFYKLWLDSQMVYSAALWTAADQSLESAQREKLLFHADAIGAQEGMRVLDVGCGWGSLLRTLVVERKVSTAIGLTLSAAQKQYFDDEPAVCGTEMRLESWEDFADLEPFDGIISIGAFEHFGRYDQSVDQRRKVYMHFFDFCARRLRRGGKLSLQTIAYGRIRRMSRFMRESIWRESELPLAHEILDAASQWFEVDQLVNHRLHYLRTLREWRLRLEHAADRAARIVGSQKVADYLRYLDESAMGFELAAVQLLRISFRRF
jgi:cyclopropane-fatty-acyl-phospholipid synthase